MNSYFRNLNLNQGNVALPLIPTFNISIKVEKLISCGKLHLKGCILTLKELKENPFYVRLLRLVNIF